MSKTRAPWCTCAPDPEVAVFDFKETLRAFAAVERARRAEAAERYGDEEARRLSLPLDRVIAKKSDPAASGKKEKP